MFRSIAVITCSLMSGLAVAAGAQEQSNPCGPLRMHNKHGPYDYRTATTGERELVEHAHFSEDVATLRKPMFQYFGPDIHYTLWAFPNHPRALLTLIALTQKEQTQQPKALAYTAECYFERALRYKPNDPLVRSIYALYLKTYNRKADALAQLDYALQISEESPMTYYNVAKIYFELNEFEKARATMKTAAALGAPFQDLIEKLRQAGHWDDAEPQDKPPASEKAK